MSLLIVAFVLNELFLPSVLPLTTRSGLREELDLPPLANFLWLCLFDLWSDVYFFPIVDYYCLIIITYLIYILIRIVNIHIAEVQKAGPIK